jgi:cytochrome c-type biogenesis protein CcmE
MAVIPDAGAPSPDENEPTGTALDLTPRSAPPATRRRWPAVAVIVAVVAGLGFVATRALSDATLFFYNADEAVAKRDELGADRFRLQGTVVDGSIEETPEGVAFTVAFNGVQVAVAHRGDPPELFRPGMPVVLEGRWSADGEVFTSDRMLVKHDEQYDAKHPDRIAEAESGGTAPAAPTAP